MELWNVGIWWYLPAAFAPLLGAWLGGVFDNSCGACVNNYCKDHEV